MHCPKDNSMVLRTVKDGVAILSCSNTAGVLKRRGRARHEQKRPAGGHPINKPACGWKMRESEYMKRKQYGLSLSGELDKRQIKVLHTEELRKKKEAKAKAKAEKKARKEKAKEDDNDEQSEETDEPDQEDTANTGEEVEEAEDINEEELELEEDEFDQEEPDILDDVLEHPDEEPDVSDPIMQLASIVEETMPEVVEEVIAIEEMVADDHFDAELDEMLAELGV